MVRIVVCLLSLLIPLRAETVSTFSIVGYDAANKEWGIAVASRYFSVGSVVPWAEAGVGAVATQANVNVGYGPRGLELLKQGLTAKQVIERLLAEDTFDGKDGRQVAVIDSRGGIAAHTGVKAPSWAGDLQGNTWTAQGNILVGREVPAAMGRAFDATSGDLAEKLFAALKAGDDAGGDSRGRQSASILVVRKGGGRNTNNDRPVYINVDDSPQPLTELRRLLDMNLGYLYQESTFRFLNAGKTAEARSSAVKAAGYSPARGGPHLTLGLLHYAAGDKAAALSELRRARDLDTSFRASLEAAAKRPVFKSILEDSEFMKQLSGR
jgi:uncharacterized Ntn-hydrolase superfamily protein